MRLGAELPARAQSIETAAMVWNSQVAVLSVHLYDGLDDALDYFLNVASPAVNYVATCQSGLVLNVGANPWTKVLYERLAEESAATAGR